MMCVFGLGNPGEKYYLTRHNIGFLACDMLAERHKVSFRYSDRLECEYASADINGNKMLIVKPMTFMNHSGRSVRKVIDYYKISILDIIIIADDIYLDFGTLRIRADGGDGGHNGLSSIKENLSSSGYSRIRCGVGQKPEQIPKDIYVLSSFNTAERAELQCIIMRVCEAVECFAEKRLMPTMNKFNKKNKKDIDK